MKKNLLTSFSFQHINTIQSVGQGCVKEILFPLQSLNLLPEQKNLWLETVNLAPNHLIDTGGTLRSALHCHHRESAGLEKDP